MTIKKYLYSELRNFLQSNSINIKVLTELDSVLKINNAIIQKKNGILKNKTFLVTF